MWKSVLGVKEQQFTPLGNAVFDTNTCLLALGKSNDSMGKRNSDKTYPIEQPDVLFLSSKKLRQDTCYLSSGYLIPVDG